MLLKHEAVPTLKQDEAVFFYFLFVLWQIQALTVCGLRAYRDLQLLRTKNME